MHYAPLMQTFECRWADETSIFNNEIVGYFWSTMEGRPYSETRPKASF